MSSSLVVIDAITQFLNSTQASWNSILIPIPQGLVVYAVDTTVVKMGDGVTLYAQLPVLFTLSQIIALTAEEAANATHIATNTAEILVLEGEFASLQTALTNLTAAFNSLSAPGAPVVYTAATPLNIASNIPFYGIDGTTHQNTTVVLPTTPVQNEYHFIKDMAGIAQQFPITIEGNGNTIDGSGTAVIATNLGGIEIYWNGLEWSLVGNPQHINMFPYGNGNPNGFVAGSATGATGVGSPPDIIWDSINRMLWICVTTGTTTSAVWAALSVTELNTPVKALGTITSGTVTLNRTQGVIQQLTVGGPLTLVLTGWIPNYSEMVLEVTNAGSATVTWPGNVNWVSSTGALTTSFLTYGAIMQVSGIDWVVFWSPDGGTTVFGKVIR